MPGAYQGNASSNSPQSNTLSNEGSSLLNKWRVLPKNDDAKKDPGKMESIDLNEEPSKLSEEDIEKLIQLLRSRVYATHIFKGMRDEVKRRRRNQMIGIIVFLVLGIIFSFAAYFMGVYATEMNSKLIAHEVNDAKRKTGEKIGTADSGKPGIPSKFVIGLLSFGGRMMTAVAAVMIVEVITAFMRRRKFNKYLTKAAGEGDQAIEEIQSGAVDTVGELLTSCAST